MIIGIDIGSQSLKVVVADRALRILGEAATSYRVHFPQPGWAEQDPSLWENALAPTIAQALGQAGVPREQILALAVCGQLDGCLAVDGDGKALTTCLTWMDRRAQQEIADVPAALLRARAGIVLDASHMAAKIRWLKHRDKGSIKAARFHQPVSYLVERLTGRAVIDHALASTSMIYAIGPRDFDPVLLDCFEIDRGELPALADAADRAGSLTPLGAELTALPAGIPVAVGTGDDFSTPLGAGLMAPGRLAVVLGTGEVVGAVHPHPIVDESGLVETHAYPGGAYFLENPGWLSGGAVAWLCGLLGFDGYEALDAEAATVPPGAENLTFIPALSGSTAPEWHAGARGCFYGLTPSHGRPHLARALLEGCAFAMRDVAERLQSMSVKIESLLLLGGGARSRMWAQMRADIVDLPVFVPHRVDTSPVGAAMLAAVAAGVIKDLPAAAELVAEPVVPIAPNLAVRVAYDQAYRRYRRLFESLKPMFGSQISTIPARRTNRSAREAGAR